MIRDRMYVDKKNITDSSAIFIAIKRGISELSKEIEA